MLKYCSACKQSKQTTEFGGGIYWKPLGNKTCYRCRTQKMHRVRKNYGRIIPWKKYSHIECPKCNKFMFVSSFIRDSRGRPSLPKQHSICNKCHKASKPEKQCDIYTMNLKALVLLDNDYDAREFSI